MLAVLARSQDQLAQQPSPAQLPVANLPEGSADTAFRPDRFKLSYEPVCGVWGLLEERWGSVLRRQRVLGILILTY